MFACSRSSRLLVLATRPRPASPQLPRTTKLSSFFSLVLQFGPGHFHLLDLIKQSLIADLQLLCRLLPVPVGPFERLHDQVAFGQARSSLGCRLERLRW